MFAYFNDRAFPLGDPEGLFVGFFWYSNTFTRMSTFIIGALTAYVSVFVDIERVKKQNAPLMYVCWAIVFMVFVLQLCWAAVFSDGNNMRKQILS